MLKKVLTVVAVITGALAVRKQFQDTRAEQELWAEATDHVKG